jgi:hypothetical protein
MGSLASRAGCALLLAATLLAGCGAPPKPTAYRDASYKRDPQVLVRFAIVPVPLAGQRGEGLDHGMERAFADTPGVQMCNQPSIMRQRMNGDRDLLWSINRILAEKYSPQDLAAGPNLQPALTPKQIETVRKVTGEAVMLLVPVEMATQPAGTSTHGHAFYRVYDLQSGCLLLQNALEVSVPETGETGDRKALVQMVLTIQQDFTQRLLN